MSDSVCHIPPASPIADPQAKDIPGLLGPPDDLLSALMAIRNLQDIVRRLAGQKPAQNNTGTFSIRVQPGPGKSDWEQSDIVQEKRKIYQNNDNTSQNWVEVNQINSLTMRNKKTGETWKWNRPPDGN